jgi:hypothetical protein
MLGAGLIRIAPKNPFIEFNELADKPY